MVTSVDRDDLRDGGAQHSLDCITAIREKSPKTRIEVLTPDFRGRRAGNPRAEPAGRVQPQHGPVPDLYRNVRPGADYQWSLTLLKNFKAQHPNVPTKSGIMLGLVKTFEQVQATLRDLRAHDVEMVTMGQYLQPTAHHHPVLRYWTPEEQGVRGLRLRTGLHPRCRSDGAFVLPCRPAGGRCRRRCLNHAPQHPAAANGCSRDRVNSSGATAAIHKLL